MAAENSTPVRKATRQKLILAGLYLSKYDSLGLKALGFESFVEAFNVIGYALGSKPASVKNYRDEFDPLFPNPRRGWHKRPTRDYCLAVYREYDQLDFESFTGLVGSFFGIDKNVLSEFTASKGEDDGTSSFAQRLITGLAAEQYFESVHEDVPQFSGHLIENTTRYGCGYDFRLRARSSPEDFLAVEVKGLKGRSGSLLMTPKEFEAASALRDRFYLFVVSNFRESPVHRIFQDPLSSSLSFIRTERTVVQVSWLANI